MKSSVAAILGGASTALAAVRGFNYAASSDFTTEFATAASLQGANDFTSARLYTMIQEGTTNSPISAIPAAISSNTTLLLGLWASEAQSAFDNEIAALKSAISQYGSQLADLVVGISVGSEDLYRISVTGLANDPTGVGQTPETLVSYISQVRDAIQGTTLSAAPVGHVDTWNAFVNSSNSAVISACDFLGLDEYPYYQTTDSNGIDNAQSLFFQAYDKVQSVASGKQIWVTEAGWPVSGSESGEAIASVSNAETFWQDVACELESREINFWWYILEDSATPDFSVSSGGKPLYNLACNSSSSSSSSTGNASSTGNSTSLGSQQEGNSTSSSSGSSSSSGPSMSGASGSATATGSATSATGSTGSGSGTGSSSSTGPSASISHFSSAAGKVETGVFGVFVAAIALAFAM